jgi:hypothetical protein
MLASRLIALAFAALAAASPVAPSSQDDVAVKNRDAPANEKRQWCYSQPDGTYCVSWPKPKLPP